MKHVFLTPLPVLKPNSLMPNKLNLVLAFALFFISSVAIAETSQLDSLCPFQTIKHSQASKVIVWQHNFDGVFDLAMATETKQGLGSIVRLSFAGSKEPKCHFPAIAVQKGGDWGWHVAWSSSAKQSLMVVRVDEEAWVSSLPKKLVSQTADAIEFSEKHGLLRLTYHLSSDDPSIKHAMVSDDEGRNWAAVDLNQ